MLKAPVISKLLAAAGIMQGVGDWRVEKGSGNFGRFSLVTEDHPQVQLLKDAAGKEAQREAIENPVAFDSETEALLKWYDTEIIERGIRKAAEEKPKGNGKAKPASRKVKSKSTVEEVTTQ